MYMWCMTQIDLIAITTALDEIDRSLLAARIKLARQRKFPNAKAAAEAIAAQHGASKSSRSYHSHESGERYPKLRDLTNYAKTFDVPLEYFVSGRHPDISEKEIEAQALLTRKKHGGGTDLVPVQTAAFINNGKSATSAVSINQLQQVAETTTIHNIPVRFISVLSAGEIRKLHTGWGGLTSMSGQQYPVPQDLSASGHSYSYRIPDDDLSMMSATGASFGPGAYIIADPEAIILPGKYVLVVLEGFDEPLFRTYRAAKPYAPGVPFSLQALNAAYEPIAVKEASRVQSIHRVIYTGSAC